MNNFKIHRFFNKLSPKRTASLTLIISIIITIFLSIIFPWGRFLFLFLIFPYNSIFKKRNQNN